MTQDMDNKKWLDEYPALKKVSQTNPFTVPAGYFEGLDESIRSAITIDELKNKIPAEGFTVPDGYFENLADNIRAQVTISTAIDNQQEAFTVPDGYFNALSNNIQSRITIENADNEIGLTVPEGYFEQLSSNIQSRINIEEAIGENNGMEVPAGYFENLSAQIQSRVFVEEALIQQEESFTVPANYFNELNSKILNKTVAADAVERKGAVIRFMRSSALKYATAACFALVVGAGVMLWPSAKNVSAEHTASYLHTELSNIPVDQIEGYVQLSMDANDTQHTITAEAIPVNDAELNAALEEYVETNL